MTRAEWLRSLSDNDLAETICEWFSDCADCPGELTCQPEGHHANGMKDWLKGEVEE